MRGRIGLGIAAILLLLFFLSLTHLDQSTHLFDLRFIKFEASLYFISIIVVGIGAFLMFLFLAAFSPLRSQQPVVHVSPPSQKIDNSEEVRAAEIAFSAGDTIRASALLAQLPPQHPDLWLAHKIAGDIAFMSGSILKAEQLYQQSIRETKGERQAPALLALAEMCESEGRTEEAEELYNRILRILPGAKEPLLRLRAIAIRNEKWNEALEWQEILESEFHGDAEEREECTIEGAGIRCQLARIELESGSIKTASALMKHVGRMTDSYPEAYLISGEIQQKISGPSSGFRVWDRGFRQTFSPALLMRIEEFFLSNSLPERAIEYYRLALSQRPDESAFQYCLAELHARLEMNQEAIKLFENLQQTRPNWSLAVKGLADLYRKIGRNSEAAALYSRLIAVTDIILCWECYNCSAIYPRYQGHCSECGRWNTIQFNKEQAGYGVEDDRNSAVFRY